MLNRLYLKGYLDESSIKIHVQDKKMVMEFEFHTERPANRQKIFDVHFCRLYGEKKINELKKELLHRESIILECESRPAKTAIDMQIITGNPFLLVKTFH